MQLISVRALVIVLSLTLVLCTAVICLSLSLTTADDAITKTESSGTRGLDSAFDSAEVNIRDVTNNYLNELASNVFHFTENSLDAQKRTVVMMMKYMKPLANTLSATTGLEIFDFYSARERMRPMAALARAYETPGVFFTSRNGNLIAQLERDTSIGANLATRLYAGLFNNGTTWGGLQAISIPVDDNFNPTYPGFPCDRTDQCKAKPGVPTFPYDPLSPTASQIYENTPDGVVLWSSIVGSGNYIGLNAFTNVHSTLLPADPVFGTTVACLNSFIDLTKISEFMMSLDFPNGTRVFGVSSNGTDAGILVGASHGGTKTFAGISNTGSLVAKTTHCTNSNDTIVVGVCEWALRQPNQFLGLSPNTTYEIQPLNNSNAIYFVKAVQMVDSGLQWTIFAVIPREIVLGHVDIFAAQTRAKIAVEARDVSDDKDKMYMVMYIVLAVVVVLLMAISVAFTLVITGPMITLQREMAAVALMDLEAVDMERPESALEEVGSMQSSFLRMCHNLKEYRNYLPASILEMMTQAAAADGNDDSKEEDEESALETLSLSGSNVRSSERASIGSRSESRSITGSQHSSNKNAASVLGHSQDMFRKRRISVMLVNVRGFHTLMDLDPSDCVSLHSRLIQGIMDSVKKNRGTPDVFLGDRFLATWNTVTRAATHRTMACQAVNHVMTTTLPELCGSKSSTDVIQLTCAVASSEARAGNMGCSGMKKYTYIGMCASLVHILERLNKRYDTHVIVHGSVQDEAVRVFRFRLLDHISVLRLDGTAPFRVFELLAARDASDKEWMYQLKDDCVDPETKFTSAVQTYLHGDYKLALASLEDYVANGGDDIQTRRLRGEIQKAKDSNVETPTLFSVDLM